MPKDLKLAAVREALERAHLAARSGSREATAGAIGEQSAYVRAVLARAQAATESWANWEAINVQLETANRAAEAIDWLELYAIGNIRMALARDAVLSAYGLTDPIQGNRLTLCRLAQWLNENETSKQMATRRWLEDQGCASAAVDFVVAENSKRIDRFQSLVVVEWQKERPSDPELAELRTALRSTRDHLAHALQSEMGDIPTLDDMRRFLTLTLELSTEACVLWTGSAVSAEEFQDFARRKAERFWSHAFAKPIEILARDKGTLNPARQ